MDLLGNYNSDSDSDDDGKATEVPAAPFGASRATTTSAQRQQQQQQQRQAPIPTSNSARGQKSTTAINTRRTKADKKKRVIGKKLLKLSAVLPEHILNQLQLTGGGGSSRRKNNDETDDDDDHYGSNSDSSDDDDTNTISSSRRRKIAIPATGTTTAPSRDYSKDEGIMGLLSELSKSGTSSASSSQNEKKRILGGGEEDVPGLVSASESTTEPEQNTKPTISEPLGAAFLTTTVETIKRKQKQPTAVRNIHETKDSLPSSKPTATSSLRATTNQAASASISGPSTTSTVAPPPLPPRAQAASFLRRTAAPVVRVATTHNSVSGNAPLSLVYNDRATQNNINSHHQIQQQPKKKKKQLSRKRQMEQMLRAGKLDEVEGDHDVQGIAHIYHQQGEHGAAMASSSSSNVRVVPTSSYDATTGSTARSTSVTGRQKTSNQLNSLLANAASLESHRAQNPQFHSMGGVGGTKQGSHRATAKRKYGW